MYNAKAQAWIPNTTQKSIYNQKIVVRVKIMSSKSAQVITDDLLKQIKTTTVTSIFADDDLLDLFVLKGGNAMDLIHQVSSRSSVDLDFSMRGILDINFVAPKVQKAIKSGFKEIGYLAFDIKMTPKPKENLPSVLASFWGGYAVEFKIISLNTAAELDENIDDMRRQAINLGKGTKFEIDISCHEYIEGKQRRNFEDHTIYVYSPEMIVCEKLRAICQQLAEYGQIIKRNGLGRQRARDFIDIETLITEFQIDLSQPNIQELLRQIFAIKKVPLNFLAEIRKPEIQTFHQVGYASVKDTVLPNITLQPFNYYFDFVSGEIEKLEALWDE